MSYGKSIARSEKKERSSVAVRRKAKRRRAEREEKRGVERDFSSGFRKMGRRRKRKRRGRRNIGGRSGGRSPGKRSFPTRRRKQSRRINSAPSKERGRIFWKKVLCIIGVLEDSKRGGGEGHVV